jgi:hypothetical protein
MLKLSETRATWELSIAWREMPKKRKFYYPIFKKCGKIILLFPLPHSGQKVKKEVD